MSAKQAIRHCITRFATARSSRGVYRAEADCTAALGGRPLDAQCAAAARRLGEWLRKAHHAVPRQRAGA